MSVVFSDSNWMVFLLLRKITTESVMQKSTSDFLPYGYHFSYEMMILT